jgi:hypothetical protein
MFNVYVETQMLYTALATFSKNWAIFQYSCSNATLFVFVYGSNTNVWLLFPKIGLFFNILVPLALSLCLSMVVALMFYTALATFPQKLSYFSIFLSHLHLLCVLCL